jgi:hypothetical protein
MFQTRRPASVAGHRLGSSRPCLFGHATSSVPVRWSSVIAADSWQSPVTVLTAAGVVLAVVAIAITLVFRRRGERRGLITYSMPVAGPLLRGQWRGTQYEHPVLSVTLGGKQVSDPYVVGLRVESRGRKDIRTADFDQGAPLTFNFGAKILSASLDTTNAAPRLTGFQVVGDEVQIPPALIRRGELLRLTILTDGLPKLDVTNPIADVDVREQNSKDGQDRIAITLIATGLLTMLVTLIVAIVTEPSNNGAILALFIIILGIALAVCGLLFMLLNAWVNYLTRRKMRSSAPPPSSS